jgi:hypothetical protein
MIMTWVIYKSCSTLNNLQIESNPKRFQKTTKRFTIGVSMKEKSEIV